METHSQRSGHKAPTLDGQKCKESTHLVKNQTVVQHHIKVTCRNTLRSHTVKTRISIQALGLHYDSSPNATEKPCCQLRHPLLQQSKLYLLNDGTHLYWINQWWQVQTLKTELRISKEISYLKAMQTKSNIHLYLHDSRHQPHFRIHHNKYIVPSLPLPKLQNQLGGLIFWQTTLLTRETKLLPVWRHCWSVASIFTRKKHLKFWGPNQNESLNSML